MILVDSNLLVYAINLSSPKHRAAQSYLQEQRDLICFTHQNVLESMRVLTHPIYPHPMTLPAALLAVTSIVDACLLLTPTRDTYELTKELIQQYNLRADAIYDTYLVATALTHGVMNIATDNEKDFRLFKEITVVNPFRTN